MNPPTPEYLQAAITMVREIIRSDDTFFRYTLRQQERPERLMVRYMEHRETLFQFVENLLNPTPVPQVRMELGIPSAWMDPVPIVATPQQQNRAMINLAFSDPPQVCAICQDTIEEGQEGRELRNCQHHFHLDCIQTWFQTSVRCPVCRNDIRETQGGTS